MPTYEYKCASCGHVLEAFQNISDAPLKLCPHCKKSCLERGFGGGLAVFSQKEVGQAHSHTGSCCPCGKSKCG